MPWIQYRSFKNWWQIPTAAFVYISSHFPNWTVPLASRHRDPCGQATYHSTLQYPVQGKREPNSCLATDNFLSPNLKTSQFYFIYSLIFKYAKRPSNLKGMRIPIYTSTRGASKCDFSLVLKKNLSLKPLLLKDHQSTPSSTHFLAALVSTPNHPSGMTEQGIVASNQQRESVPWKPRENRTPTFEYAAAFQK